MHRLEAIADIRERAPHVALTLSSEILPEMREFERTSTAVTNAYVMPVMGRYLASLEGELRRLEARAPLLIMQSNGGVMTAEGGRRRPVHVIESGPAAGVIATAALARAIGAPNALSLVRNPKISPSEPRNSAIITITTIAAGNPIPVIPSNVTLNPPPPNHPNTFCAPCGNITAPSAMRRKIGTMSLFVANNFRSIFLPFVSDTVIPLTAKLLLS